LARLDHLHDLCQLAHQTSLLQRKDIDLVGTQALQVAQRDLGIELERLRLEAALGQAALQRHLAAFEADLVEAARARLLALVAAAARFAEARADAAADAALGVLGARAGLQRVEFHVLSSARAQSTFTRYETLLIIPRTAGVSSNSRSLL